MNTPTPRTDATCKALVAMLEPLRGGSRVTDAEMKALEGVITAFAKCATDLERDLAAREEELAQWTKWGVIEVMIRNPNIASFVKEKEAELAQARAGTPHSKMVDRFLGWQLPKDFAPDCGISFDGRPKDAMGYAPSWPVGTNLFTSDQALSMFRHCVPTVMQDSEFHPDWSMLEATRDALREVSEELARVKAERDAAVFAINNHNKDCKASCEEQRSRNSCGFASYYPNKNCPNCPEDWIIDAPIDAAIAAREGK